MIWRKLLSIVWKDFSHAFLFSYRIMHICICMYLCVVCFRNTLHVIVQSLVVIPLRMKYLSVYLSCPLSLSAWFHIIIYLHNFFSDILHTTGRTCYSPSFSRQWKSTRPAKSTASTTTSSTKSRLWGRSEWGGRSRGLLILIKYWI